MIGIVLLTLFVLLGPLALLFGVDSRINDERDTRSWWPGAASSAVAPSPPPPTDAAPPTRGRRAGQSAWAVPESSPRLARLGASTMVRVAGKNRGDW